MNFKQQKIVSKYLINVGGCKGYKIKFSYIIMVEPGRYSVGYKKTISSFRNGINCHQYIPTSELLKYGL